MRPMHPVTFAATFAMAALLSHTSYAFDLSGAWTTNISACSKIFEKTKENELKIKGDSGMYGDAFIVRNNAITGPAGTCTIKVRKSDGPVTHLVAVCAAGNVALSTFQFNYRVIDADKIVRIFPGVEALDVSYGRCKF
jgi:hypothetical protein